MAVSHAGVVATAAVSRGIRKSRVSSIVGPGRRRRRLNASRDLRIVSLGPRAIDAILYSTRTTTTTKTCQQVAVNRSRDRAIVDALTAVPVALV